MVMTHRDVVCRMVQTNGFENVAEIGLGTGELYARLLALPGVRVAVGVDTGRRADRVQALRTVAAHYPAKAVLHIMPSVRAAKLVPDGSLDFVFIDAGHSYGAVKADILAWRPKVRLGGILCGHDYHLKFPGVVKAVRELIPNPVIISDQFIWSNA